MVHWLPETESSRLTSEFKFQVALRHVVTKFLYFFILKIPHLRVCSYKSVVRGNKSVVGASVVVIFVVIFVIMVRNNYLKTLIHGNGGQIL